MFKVDLDVTVDFILFYVTQKNLIPYLLHTLCTHFEVTHNINFSKSRLCQLQNTTISPIMACSHYTIPNTIQTLIPIYTKIFTAKSNSDSLISIVIFSELESESESQSVDAKKKKKKEER